MTNLPKTALDVYAYGNGTSGKSAGSLELHVIRFWEKEMK